MVIVGVDRPWVQTNRTAANVIELPELNVMPPTPTEPKTLTL